ncbi:hypothetical protein [Candidatus Parabeggiatoa sp. HSG14]|uniref:hypothetical protein n=1 Tax=Candidatus Parabeggiatoa sp. HSG14 TaxID=3055593 RepID=UPI0025A89447|nr:hypothetical protein [Thiotrichales bacterium HSG14]
MNKLLRTQANYSLSAAIAAVGKLLERETLEIEIASNDSAKAFLTEALNLGAVGKIESRVYPIHRLSRTGKKTP